ARGGTGLPRGGRSGSSPGRLRRQKRAVEERQAADSLRGTGGPARGFSGARRQAAGQFPVLQQPAKGLRERPAVARRDQQAGGTVRDTFRETPGRGGSERQPGGHRLEGDDAAALGEGGNCPSVGRREEEAEVRQNAGEVRAAGETQVPRLLLQ